MNRITLLASLATLLSACPVLAQVSNTDFESTIGVVDRGGNLAALPSHPAPRRDNLPQAAESKNDLFAAGRPLSLTDTLLAPGGLNLSAGSGLSAVSSVTGGLTNGLVNTVTQLSEITQVKKVGGLLGGLLGGGGTQTP